MTARDRVVAVARSQVGVTEQRRPDLGYPENWTTYADEIAPLAQGQPWCGTFTSWVFQKAGVPLPPIQPAAIPDGGFAYCPYAVTYAIDHGEVVTFPQPGDIALFDWQRNGNEADHVGIVTRTVDSTGHFVSVEGNTSVDLLGSQSNGGGVYERSRSVRDVLVFWHPTVLDTPDPPSEEDDDMAITFPVGAVNTTGRRIGRYPKFYAELADKRLKAVEGATFDFPQGVTNYLGVSILDIDAALPDVNNGRGVIWPVRVAKAADQFGNPVALITDAELNDFAIPVRVTVPD